MITELRIRNFKCLADTGRLAVRPLTFLVGPNSSGKTSILQSLLLLRQTVESRDLRNPLSINGPYVQLGSYEGEQQYLELLEDYQELNATYNELKAKNDRLLTFPDINGDGRIDMVDVGTVARHFQEHYP